MKTNTNILSLLTLALLMVVFTGCSPSQRKKDITSTSGSVGRQTDESIVDRFQEPGTRSRTAVESAIELSQRYAQLSELAAALREENKELINENNKFREQITLLQAKLNQTQKELKEANDLLIEMLTELNNWKTNILGFRNEMREAQKAQIEALLKVLDILGGEIDTELSLTDVPQEQTTESLKESTSVTGEPNE